MANKIRIGLIGDSHLRKEETDGANFTKALKYFSENFAEPLDALILTGDIVYQTDKDKLFPEIYDCVYEQIKKYANGIPLMYIMGNHEYPQGCTDESLNRAALKLFSDKASQDLNLHITVSGYHIFGAGCINYQCDRLPEETEDFLIKGITEAINENPPHPVFLAVHFPVSHTVFDESHEMFSENFVSFLKTHPQIIVISAHFHVAAQLVQNIYQYENGATHFQTPMVSGGILTEINCDTYAYLHPHELSYIEIEDGFVKIFKADIDTGKQIGKPWEVDIAGIVNKTAEPLYTAKKLKSDCVPYFEEGDKIILNSVYDTTLIYSYPRGKCKETGALQDDFVYSHRVVIREIESGKEVLNKVYISDFYNLNPPEFIARQASDLHWERDFEIEISPISIFGIEGKPICARFTTF